MVLRAKGQEMLKKKKKILFRLEEIKKRIPNKNIILKKKKKFCTTFCTAFTIASIPFKQNSDEHKANIYGLQVKNTRDMRFPINAQRKYIHATNIKLQM